MSLTFLDGLLANGFLANGFLANGFLANGFLANGFLANGFLQLPLDWLAELRSPGATVGSLPIRWYGVLIASAVLIGVSLSGWLAKRRGMNPDLFNDLAIWLVVGAIPFARLYYVLFQWNQPTRLPDGRICSYAQCPDEIFKIWHGGIAIHGAILGGLLAAWLFARFQKVSLWRLVDLVVPSLALGQAIGRWGNFFNSEAFGSPMSDLPWKLYIPPSQRPEGLQSFEYFHPTFLYESLWNLMVFALLMLLFQRGLQSKSRLKDGTLFCFYLVAYSLGRFWIEGLRTDSLMLGPLKMAQVISLVGAAIGILGLWWLHGMKRSLPDTGDRA
jgi:phosphatidylglycerol---prolipoprotein diacylglyceryl transferase